VSRHKAVQFREGAITYFLKKELNTMPNRATFPDNEILAGAKAAYNKAMVDARVTVEDVITLRKAIIEIEPRYSGSSTDHLDAAVQHLFLAHTFKGEGDVPKAENPYRNGTNRVTVSV